MKFLALNYISIISKVRADPNDNCNKVLFDLAFIYLKECAFILIFIHLNHFQIHSIFFY